MSGVDRAARLQEITERRGAATAVRYASLTSNLSMPVFSDAESDFDWLLAEVVRLRDVDAALQRVSRAHEQWAFNEISDLTFIMRVQQALLRAGETGDHTIRRGQEN